MPLTKKMVFNDGVAEPRGGINGGPELGLLSVIGGEMLKVREYRNWNRFYRRSGGKRRGSRAVID